MSDSTRQQYDEHGAVFMQLAKHKDQFLPRFHDWMLENWDTWLAFVDAANMVRKRGLTSYSAYVIVNVLRWRADTRGIKFALSNTMIPDLARLYNLRHGELFTTSTRFGKHTKETT